MLREHNHSVDERTHTDRPSPSGSDAAMADQLSRQVAHHILAHLPGATAELRNDALLTLLGKAESACTLDAVVEGRAMVLRAELRRGVLLRGAAAVALLELARGVGGADSHGEQQGNG